MFRRSECKREPLETGPELWDNGCGDLGPWDCAVKGTAARAGSGGVRGTSDLKTMCA